MTPTTETVRRGGAGMRAGVAGVTVELLNDTGEVINTTVTDSRGQYRFGSVAETGDYRIRVIAKEGTKVVSADTLSVNVSRGDVRLHKLDFRLATV